MTRAQAAGGNPVKPANQPYFSEKTQKHVTYALITLLALAAIGAVIYGGLSLGTRNVTLLGEAGTWGLTGAGGAVLLVLFIGAAIIYRRSKTMGISGNRGHVLGDASGAVSGKTSRSALGQASAHASRNVSQTVSSPVSRNASGNVLADEPRNSAGELRTTSGSTAGTVSSAGSRPSEPGTLKVKITPIPGTFSRRETAKKAPLFKERQLLCKLIAPNEYVKADLSGTPTYYFADHYSVSMSDRTEPESGRRSNCVVNGGEAPREWLQRSQLELITTATLDKDLADSQFKQVTFDQLLVRAKDIGCLARLSYSDRIKMGALHYEPLTLMDGKQLKKGEVEKFAQTLPLSEKSFTAFETQGLYCKITYVIKKENGKVTIVEEVEEIVSNDFEIFNDCARKLVGEGFTFEPQMWVM